MRTLVFRISLLIIMPVVFFSGSLYAEGLDTLIEVGRNMGEIAKASQQESKNFEKAKKAVESDALKKGMSKDEVMR